MLNDDIKKYIDDKTEAFKKELDEEVKQMIKDTNQGQVKSVWDLKIADGEKYYRLDGEGDVDIEDFNTKYDEQARDIGNAFLTREEAEFEVKRRKIEAIIRKYSRPFKYEERNYYIEYQYDRDMLVISVYHYINMGIPYFESEEIAQKVIDEIGEDRLIKNWFRVKE